MGADQRVPGTVQSVERAFGLLELIAEAERTTLTRLASAVDLPVPTTFRLLRTLVALGYVRQPRSREYSLGLRLRTLGERVDQQFATVALPHLQQLVRETGESANLAVLEKSAVVYVAQAQSTQAMRIFTEVGYRASPHCTGVGKAMLAAIPRAEAHRVVGRAGLERRTDRTITDWPTLERELDAVARRGYAVDDGEQEEGVCCYAVPVRDVTIPMALSVSGPALRMGARPAEAFVPLLLVAAARLAAELSDQPGPARG